MAQITNCLKLISRINEGDQDSLISRIDELQALGVPAQRAQVQAAIDVLARLQREGAPVVRSAKREPDWWIDGEVVASNMDALESASGDAPFVLGDGEYDVDRFEWRTASVPIAEIHSTNPMETDRERDSRFASIEAAPRLERPILEMQDGRVAIIDGWHRIAVFKRRGEEFVDALVGRPLEDVRHSAARPPSGAEIVEVEDGFDAMNNGERIDRLRDSLRRDAGGIQRSAARDVTETPGFKRWFGDSKVVDADGRPLVVYHGTNQAITAFDPARIGLRDPGFFGSGFYFTPDEVVAQDYASGEFDPPGPRPEVQEVIPVYLSLQNPFVWDMSDEGAQATRAALAAAGIRRESVRGNSASLGNAKEREIFNRSVREQGYDGVVVRDEDGIQEVVAFRPEQIKSATGNNGQFDPSNADITKSAKRNNLGLYSALERGIEGMQTKQAPAGAWKAQIKGLVNKGIVKQDEITWSGVEDWLDLQNGKVSKEAISEYLRQGGVQVQEVVLGNQNDRQKLSREYDRAIVASDAAGGSMNPLYIANLAPEDRKPEEQALLDAWNRVNENLDESWLSEAGGPEYEQYTIPGGDNYREVLLTLPVNQGMNEKKIFSMREKIATLHRPRNVSGGESVEEFDKRYAEGNRLQDEMRELMSEQVRAEKESRKYKSGHWDQPNVLAHIRVNDRVDADGRKVLFVEELQSDWGQSFKKYKDQNTNDLETALRQVDKNAPPDGPFIQKTEGWLNLALKRVIAMAVDGGYDAVAFVNGDQSADRYDLSKQVESVSAYKVEGGYKISAKTKDGDTLPARSAKDESEIADLLGKELAAKIVRDLNADGMGDRAMNVYSGLDLKVGGDGMRAFYDRIVPNAVKALLKKVGGSQLETVGIPDSNAGREVIAAQVPGESMWGVYDRQNGQWLASWESETYTSDPDGAELTSERTAKSMASAIMRDAGVMLEQPGFTITDAMREKVSAEGLPLFSRKRGWQGFPDSVVDTNLGAQSKDPSYEAAKAGDMKAALELVSRVMSSDAEDKVRSMIGDSKPIVVSVHAEEAAGRNKIPLATAIELGDRLGLEVDTKIVQATRAKRTGADGMARIGVQPEFTGDVVRGADYLIVDDTLTQGGTIAQLKTYIEEGGGHVVGAFALSGKQYSAKISLDAQTLSQLREQYGSIEPWWRSELGYGFDGLTQSEARFILKSGLSPDQVRDRVAATRQAAGIGAGAQDQAQLSTKRGVTETPEYITSSASLRPEGLEIVEVEDGFDAMIDGKRVGRLRDNLPRGVAEQLDENASVDIVKVDNEFKGKGVGSALYDAFNEKHGGRIAPSGKTSLEAWALWKRKFPEKVDLFVESEAARIRDGADPMMVVRNITDPEVARRVSAAVGDMVIRSTRRQTETPEFKAWFGDSKAREPMTSSKQKFADMPPQVMYHTTRNADFTEFEANRPTINSTTFGDDETSRAAIFFTPSVADSNAYGELSDGRTVNGAATMPVYLRASEPLYLTDGIDEEDAQRLMDAGLSSRFVYNALGHWSMFDGADGRDLVETFKRAGYDSVVFNDQNPNTGDSFEAWAVFDPRQIKSAIGNNGQFDPSNPDITKSLPRIPGLNAGPVERTTGDYGREYTPQQLRMFKNVGRTTSKPALIDRLKEARKDLGKKMAQGIVDQFRPIRELGGNAYTLARLSKGSAGAFEALLGHGKLKIVDGAYDADTTGGFLDLVGKPLGKELEDFMFWVASNRAETLSLQDREHLFTQEDIDAGKSLADGDLEFDYLLANGATTRDRRAAYEDALKKFNEFNKNVLDIAEQSGLIDGESRQFWEGEFYVPFYRVSEEDGEFVGAKIKGGLARQRAFHELKGGSQKLNSDLLANTMRNWAHLIDASAKNRAAKATLEAAQAVGIALESDAETVRQLGKSMGGKGGTVWFMDGGQQRHFLIGDPYLLEAINSLEYAGLRGPLMDALSTMKHWLTVGVTASPAFKVRNLIRDSIQAISLSGLSYNPMKNLVEGYKATDRESQDYVSALASGGLIRFGTMLEGNAAERVRRLVQKGVPASTILNTPGKVKDFYGKFVEPAIEAYQELGNRGEEINRASLYKQLRAQGINHAEASLMARDLMDFSMQGTWTSIRFLTQVVPFLNARLQGLYKLGRGAAEDPKRFAMVAGATAMVSIALLGAYGDDDDWKKREDWDRDGFWWFKFGGTAFRIPKPFEVGAIATLAERGVELFTNDEFTAKRFGSRVMHLLGDNLAMNPIPQAVKPMLDIYANKDSFSGRPIESMGMERLQAEYRFNVNTSMVARGASSALNAVTRTVGAESLSPVQIDSLIRGYFGWLGTFVVAGADMAVRPLTNEPARPQADYLKVVTQGFLKTLPEPSSKYVSAMYDQAKIMEQAYATHRRLLKEGKLDDAREFAAENKDLLERHRLIEAVKKTQSNINRRIREIEISDMDPARKRDEIQKLRDQADRSARAVY